MTWSLGLRFLPVLAVVLPGCIGSLPDDGATSGFDACRDGEDQLFLKAQHHPGFTTYEYQLMYYSIDQDGTLFYVRANDARSAGGPDPGTGRLVPKTGALHNLTLADVRAGMQRVGAWDSDRDYNVSQAFRDRADAAFLDRFCETVLAKFYDYGAEYKLENVADCDGFTFTITTAERGTHSSYSYCNAGPQDVRKAFDEMTRRSREKLGIEGI